MQIAGLAHYVYSKLSVKILAEYWFGWRAISYSKLNLSICNYNYNEFPRISDVKKRWYWLITRFDTSGLLLFGYFKSKVVRQQSSNHWWAQAKDLCWNHRYNIRKAQEIKPACPIECSTWLMLHQKFIQTVFKDTIKISHPLYRP